MSATAPALEDRYGRAPRQRRRTSLPAIALVVVLLVLAAAWAIWTGLGGAGATTALSTTGYTIRGDRAVTVGWVVSGDVSHALVCAIEAQDGSGAVLGLKEVEVPVTGRDDRSGTTTVLVTRRPDTGLIESCRRA